MGVTESWPTFWCEPTGFAVVSLRRFTFGVYHRDGDPIPDGDGHEVCPAEPIRDDGYQDGHDGSVVVLERAPVVWTDDHMMDVVDRTPFEGSPLWPETCSACGQSFPVWVCESQMLSQVVQDPVYKADGVFEGTMRQMPVGAMWDATWLHGTDWVGADGISLNVCLPPDGGHDTWCCDCPSTDGKPWTREGDPRQANVTAAPSILTPRWHGFLRNGEILTA